MSGWESVLTSGIVLGSLYALMASGLTLVWSTLGIFNFMHGVLMTVGAYLAWQFAVDRGFGLGLGLGIVLAVVCLVALGCLVEILLIRPFYGRKDLVQVTVMTTLAGLTFLENSTLLIWGPRLKQLPPVVEGQFRLLGLTMSNQEALIVLLSPLILLALWVFLRFTRVGNAIRAVGQNRESAQLMGLNVQALFMTTFALATVLAGLAGVLLGSIRFITPTLGSDPLTKALIVSIFGGLGSVGGSIGAAYVVGMLEATSVFAFGLYWTPSILFVVMIVVLIFRPNGLFGRQS
ncbi:MAG: branched-chain amino acid ABC transporter permease [Meiothermus sp.]|nr:branched-chain amino acid ABC transporter permease [Meiothermus sp.]